jgi:hypothetical protein
MDLNGVAWPRKTRELHSHHFDSTVWNDFRFRPDDVVTATYAKAPPIHARLAGAATTGG